MAIKSRTTDLGEAGILTEYLYLEARVTSSAPIQLVWKQDPELDQEVTRNRGAESEQRLLAVDDVIPDDIKVEWLQVGINPDVEGEFLTALNVTARNDWYISELRKERDALLAECEWEVTRHRDQIDSGVVTTLTGDQYSGLLMYRQALRDWPSTETNIFARTAPVR